MKIKLLIAFLIKKNIMSEKRMAYIRIAIEAEKIGDRIVENKSEVKSKDSFIEKMKSTINTYSCNNREIIRDCDKLPELDTSDPFRFIDLFYDIVEKYLFPI